MANTTNNTSARINNTRKSNGAKAPSVLANAPASGITSTNRFEGVDVSAGSRGAKVETQAAPATQPTNEKPAKVKLTAQQKLARRVGGFGKYAARVAAAIGKLPEDTNTREAFKWLGEAANALGAAAPFIAELTVMPERVRQAHAKHGGLQVGSKVRILPDRAKKFAKRFESPDHVNALVVVKVLPGGAGVVVAPEVDANFRTIVSATVLEMRAEATKDDSDL